MDKLPPGQIWTKKFPVMTYGPTPVVTLEQFSLTLDGQVANPQTLNWNQLMALPQQSVNIDFHCVTQWSKPDTVWAGVPTTVIKDVIQPLETAKHLLIHCYGGYTTNVTLEDFLAPNCLLAHSFDGQPLEVDHGFPLRLLIPHLYAWKSAKWIQRLEFVSQEVLGFWEVNGYHRRGDPFKQERFS